MQFVQLITAAFIVCMALPGADQARGKKPKPSKPKPSKPPKFCVGKDGERYEIGKEYLDTKSCILYTCVKRGKGVRMESKKMPRPCTGKPTIPDILAATTTIATSAVEGCSNMESMERKMQAIQDSLETILEMLNTTYTVQPTSNKPGVSKVDAIKAVKATVQNIADGLAGLANGRKKREASDNENKLLEILSEIATYLQTQCGSANGNCEVKKIEDAKEQLKLTYDKIKATGTISPGFTQSFEEQKNSFETAADAAEAAQATGSEGDCAYAGVDPEHTMCTTEPPEEVGEEDGLNLWKGKCDIKLRVVDEVGAESILKQVNKRRNEVAGGIGMEDNKQPTASNMKKLVWNDELAMIAQRWADQCITSEPGIHDNGHRATLDGTITGQNGWIGSFARQINDDYYGDYEYDYRVRREASTIQNKTRVKRKVYWNTLNINGVNTETLDDIQEGIGQVTDAWFNEYKKFTDPNLIKQYVFEYATGHYTQEMWAESGEIGCGFNFFSNGIREGGQWEDYTLLMHCNFKPSGNMVGGEIYKIGPPASACPAGYSADAEYPNLCSK